MRIAILAHGTRGDVQPALTLGHALAQRGHSVVLTVNINLVGWAARSGLEIIALPVDSEQLLKSARGAELLARGDVLTFTRELLKSEQRANAAIVDAMSRAVVGADLIVSTMITVHRGSCLAERHDLPHGLLATIPTVATAQHPALMFPQRTLLLPALNRFSHTLLETLWWQGCKADIHAMRARLGLPRLRARPRVDQLPLVGAYSSVLSPKPSDWADHQHVTGFFTMPKSLRMQLGEHAIAPALDAWLDAGEPPVFFGFGSMPVPAPRALLATIARATEALGLRALVGAGWSDFGDLEAGAHPHVFVASTLDHDRVLPRCRAAVHHGGAGTTGSVLRAGIPALVASVMADQPYWGRRLADVGAGTTMRFRDLTPATLERGLRTLLSARIVATARELGMRVRSEDGAPRAAQLVERWRRTTRARADVSYARPIASAT